MSFTLSGGSPTAEVSASATIDNSYSATQAKVTVTASAWLVYSGAYVYSSGVVCVPTCNGSSKSATTLFGNATGYWYYSSGKATKTFTFYVDKTTAAKSVSWSVAFYSYIDGTSLGVKDTKSGTVSMSAKTSYVVSYNANGGTGAPSSQTKWHGTSLTLSSTTPTRTGYTFQGWGTSASDTSVDYAAGASYTANSAITLYAIWKADTYAISFDANGGSGAPSSVTKTYGVDLTLPTTVPTRTNYNFLGWATSASAATAQYSAGGSFTTEAATTLYAVWELAYIPPTIYSLAVGRCDSAGAHDDYGTYALVSFSWETCQLLGSNEVASIKIVCNGATTTITPGGTSGSVSQVVGGSLSVESEYAITVTVTDTIQSGSTSRGVVIPKASFPLDLLAGGTGAAFGKPAEKDGLEVNWDAQFNKQVVIDDGSGEGSTYDVAAEIASLKAAWDSVSQEFDVDGFNTIEGFNKTLSITVKGSVATLRLAGIANEDLSNWYGVFDRTSGAEEWVKAYAMPATGVASCCPVSYLNETVAFLKITQTTNVCSFWIVKSGGIPSGTEVNITFTWCV